MRFLFILSVFIFALNIVQTARAEEPIPNVVMLDGKEYSREQLVDFLLQSAIANYAPQKNLKIKKNFERWSISEMKARYPWISDYYLKDQNLSKSNVVNKFGKKKTPYHKRKLYEKAQVQVAVGYPHKLKDFGSSWDYWLKQAMKKRYYSFGESNLVHGGYFMNIVENETMDIVEALRAKDIPVNLSYRLNENEHLGLKSDRIAQIRIIPFGRYLESTGMAEYKSDSVAMIDTSFTNRKVTVFRSFLIFYLDEKFEFTPGSYRSVEGYALTDENNELKMTFCYIYNGHKADMRQALIQECILRSLGLINFYQGEGFLSAWNEILEPDVDLSADDGHRKKMEAYKKTPPNDIPSLSELDLYLLNMLYRDDVKAGMNADEIRQTLMEND